MSAIFPDTIVDMQSICESCGKKSSLMLNRNDPLEKTHSLCNNIVPSDTERVTMVQDIAGIQLSQPSIREKSLLSPIKKLPEDVLRYLFLVCQRHLEPDGFIDAYSAKTFVRIIANICVYWRVVALSTPELWSKIKLYTDAAPRKRHHMVGPFLERCISLSGELPLSIDLESLPTDPLTDSRGLEEICIQSFANSANRWKDFSDSETGVGILNDIIKYISPDPVFSSLERLSVVWFTRSISFKNAPSLRHLKFWRVKHPMSTFVDMPWGQITTLESGQNDFDDGEFYLFLNSLPKLTSFTLIIGKNSGITRSHLNDAVVFSYLKTFKLSTWPESRWTNVLDAFTAPHIKSLHLKGVLSTSSIREFFNRSYCTPTVLKLTDMQMYLDAEWITQSSSLRKVKIVHLKSCFSYVKEIILLTRKDYNSCMVFPQLQTLKMHWGWGHGHTSAFPLTIVPLINMIKSRITPTDFELEGEPLGYLKYVTISFPNNIQGAKEEALNEFIRSDLVRQSGVIITVYRGRALSNLFAENSDSD